MPPEADFASSQFGVLPPKLFLHLPRHIPIVSRAATSIGPVVHDALT